MITEASGTLLHYARSELLHAVRHARNSIWLASPFLSFPVAKRICSSASNAAAAERRLLTSLTPRSVQAGVLDPKGLRRLQQAGFEIRTAGNLHAKLALIDERWGLVGSGNLTEAGLGRDPAGDNRARIPNIELGVLLSPVQIAEAILFFADWWDQSELVTPELLSEYAKLPRFRTQNKGVPGTRSIPLPTNAWVDDILSEADDSAEVRSYWMKSAYHREGVSRKGWWHQGWISDHRSAPYEPGDLVVLYLSASRGGPGCCPAILRAKSRSVEDRQLVEAQGTGDSDHQWNFVTTTEVCFEISIPEAPSPEDFGISSRSTQFGYRSLTRSEFEAALIAMSSE